MIIVRPEEAQHAEGVYRVEEKAFDRPNEADLCASMRKRRAVTLSLVALEDGDVIGHVLFTPVTIHGESGDIPAVGLGPLAVLPGRQKQGIGARLIRAGLEEIRQQGHSVVVVLGAPAYYTRFGFEPASRYAVSFSDPNAPADAFMLLELRRGAMEDRGGVAHYQPEFNEV